jgi:hypothetical protein
MVGREDEDSNALVSVSDAMQLGFKLVEMADRAAAIDPAVPGAIANWQFELDGKLFRVTVSRAALNTGETE